MNTYSVSNINISTITEIRICFAAAAVAQWVKHPELRSLKRGATELTQVIFPVAALELGKTKNILATPSVCGSVRQNACTQL